MANEQTDKRQGISTVAGGILLLVLLAWLLGWFGGKGTGVANTDNGADVEQSTATSAVTEDDAGV